MPACNAPKGAPHCRKVKAYLAAAAMNSTAARRSASDAWAAPPRGGIAPLPLATLLYSASMPAGRRADQAALSPNLGAPATPAAWHTWQACLYRASPAPAPAAAAAATGAAAAGAASAAGGATGPRGGGGGGGGGGSGFCGCRSSTSRSGCCRLGKFGTGSIGHVGHGPCDFGVVEVAATLWGHRPLALEGGLHQRFKAGRDAGRPGASIGEFGSTSGAGCMAGGALALVHLFASTERAVGVTDLDHAHLLDALGNGFLRIDGTSCRLVCRRDVQDQANDGKDRNHKREKYRDQQLLGVLDRAGMGFFVVVVAHDVL